MAIKFSGVQFMGSLAGLENYENDVFNFSVNSHSLGSHQASKWTTSYPIKNATAISSAQLQYAGLETVWRYTSGAVVGNYNGGQYQIETLSYYLNSNYVVETYVINETGGTITIPQFFVNFKISLFIAPF